MEIDRREIAIHIIVGGIFAICCFFFFQFVIPYHFFIKEQSQLFLFTSDYFISYFSKPAWLGCYLGDFLTQFYYLRGGGAIVLTLVLLTEWLLFVQVLKRIGIYMKATLFALIPVFVECILHCQLSYSLASTVSVILVLLLFWLYTYFNHKWLSLFAGLLFVPLLYHLAGALFFLFPLLVIIYEISRQQWRWVYWLLMAMLAAVFPYLTRSFYLLTIDQAYTYPDTELSVRGIKLKREKLFALSCETYFDQRDKVLELADKYKMQHPVATYYTNIALSERNELPDKLLKYYQPASQGFFISVTPTSDWLDVFFSSDVFFHLGDMNMAQHSAMQGMILSPYQRSSRMIKRLAEINLILGDSITTQKYLRILDATLFHRKWSLQHAAMLDEASPNEWLMWKRSQVARYDTLRTATDYDTAMQVLVRSNPDNKQALHYLLCYHLMNKDLLSFKETFDSYCKGKPEYLYPLYCEALLIQLTQQKVPQKVMDSYIIPNNIVVAFTEYSALYKENEGNSDALKESHATTYWFYYHFAQLKER